MLCLSQILSNVTVVDVYLMDGWNKFVNNCKSGLNSCPRHWLYNHMAADDGIPTANLICSGTQSEGCESSASPGSSSLCSFQITHKIPTACALILYPYLYKQRGACLPRSIVRKWVSPHVCVERAADSENMPWSG